MRTLSTPQAHKQLVTNHQTMKWETAQGRLTIRKTAGRYIVRLEDYEFNKTTISTFATLAGATIAADNLREYYL